MSEAPANGSHFVNSRREFHVINTNLNNLSAWMMPTKTQLRCMAHSVSAIVACASEGEHG